jgi:hypothetical protein
VDSIDNREPEAIVPAARDDHPIAAYAHGPGVEDVDGLSRGFPDGGSWTQQFGPCATRHVIIELGAQYQHRAIGQPHGDGIGTRLAKRWALAKT